MSSGSAAGGVAPSAGTLRHDPEALLPMRRLAYTVLPPSMGRRRRARAADSLARRALELGDTRTTARVHLIRDVLRPGRTWMPSPLAHAGERSTPASRATERALAGMVPASRAAYALLHLENLTPAHAIALLDLAGVQDAATAVSIAERHPLDPEAVRALVVPAPPAAMSPRLAAGIAAAVVLAVAAPVIAVTAFDDSSGPQPVSTSERLDSQRRAAVDAAKAALEEARAREANATAAAEMDQSFQRILRQLNDSLDDPGLSRRAERRLRSLKAAILRERDRLAG